MVEVVVARLEERPQVLQGLWAWLCGAERRRASRLRFERDRRRFVAARARLRQLLGARLGVAPQAVEIAYGGRGKPALARRFAGSGLRFNLSHSEGVALYAFSRAGEVGVDLEALRALPEADRIAARVFAPRERATYLALAPRHRPLAFLRLWTRKEAFVKAHGAGLSMPLDSLDVSGLAGVRSFAPLPGFIAAVALHPA